MAAAVGLTAGFAALPASARVKSADRSFRAQHKPVQVSWEDILQVWKLRREAMRAKDFKQADSHLLDLLHMKARSGWPDFFPLAAALRHEARFNAENDACRRARMYAKVAVALAPDDPDNYWTLARMQLAYDWTDVPAIMRSSFRAAMLYLSDWKVRNIFWGNMAIWLLELGLVLSFVLLGLFYLRHWRYLFHDFHHLFPRGTSRFQVGLVKALVLVVPVLLHVGLLWYIVLLVALVWWSLEFGERMLVSALVLGWMLVALLLPLLLSPITSLASSGWDRYHAARDPAVDAIDNRVLARDDVLRASSIHKTVPAEVLYILGTRALRGGVLPGMGRAQTISRARKLLTEAASRKPWSPHIQTALGVVYFRSSDLDSAVNAFKAAIRLQPRHVPAAYNLSRIHFQRAEPGKGRHYLNKATVLKPRQTALLSEATRLYGDDFMALTDVPDEFFADSASDVRVRRHLMADQVWHYLAAGKRPVFVGGALGIWFLLLIMAYATKRSPHARACPRCGMPVCRRCNPELPTDHQCGQCYHAFVMREGVESRVRVDKEIQIHRYQARRDAFRRVLGLLLAGSVHVLDGRLLGAFFLVLFLGAMVLLLHGLSVIHDLLPLGDSGSMPRVVLGISLLVVAFGWSWLVRWRED